MKKVWQFASYVLVAMLSAILTLYFFTGFFHGNQPSKLQELSDLIDERFIGEADRKE